MLYSKGITRVHLEVTNKCNAECPMCPRRYVPIQKNTEMSLNDFKLFFPKDFLETVTDFVFCGNFGEPTLCKDIIKIHEYINSINPNVRFNISTNGGTRTPQFWNDLGQFYCSKKDTKSFVKFCIDGLEDTNHIYRRHIKWEKLMKNVEIFNSTGALSDWSFIPFKHNQEQFDIIKTLYKELGFNRLHIRNCRPIHKKSEYLRTYTTDDKSITIEDVDDPFFIECKRPISTAAQSERCVARNKQEIYVDTWGNLFPCCWYATKDHTKVNPRFSLYLNDLKSILNNSFFDHEVTDTWGDVNSLCNSCCWSLCKKSY